MTDQYQIQLRPLADDLPDFSDLVELQKHGTDKQFREWIQRQPSCISGRFSEYVNGEGRCVAAHVRRSKDSGTGYKAPYSCVPLTQIEHLRQHQHGEEAFGGKEFFDNQLEKYRRLWVTI